MAQRTRDQVIATLRRPLNLGQDVKVVFRRGGTQAKPRCFVCVLVGSDIACTEIDCPEVPKKPKPPVVA